MSFYIQEPEMSDDFITWLWDQIKAELLYEQTLILHEIVWGIPIGPHPLMVEAPLIMEVSTHRRS